MLAKVKTKLRNTMHDERMSSLATLAFYPDIVKPIDLISLCNEFVTANHHTSTREKLFGKFVPSDLINNKNPFSSTEVNPIVNQERHAMA